MIRRHHRIDQEFFKAKVIEFVLEVLTHRQRPTVGTWGVPGASWSFSGTQDHSRTEVRRPLAPLIMDAMRPTTNPT